jgi:hypothetical protein
VFNKDFADWYEKEDLLIESYATISFRPLRKRAT